MKLLIVLITVLGFVALSVVGRAPVASAPFGDGKTQPKIVILSRKAAKINFTVPFNHETHTLNNYSPDFGCVECHHTDQPKSALRGMLKTSLREVVLTAAVLEQPDAKPVEACSSCHAREGERPTGWPEIPQITYESDVDYSTILTNEEAYHRNCIACHTLVQRLKPATTAPVTCIECHSGKNVSGENAVRWFRPILQRIEQRIPEAMISEQVNKAAKKARESLARDVERLKVMTVTKPDPRQAGQNVGAYEARAASNVLTNNKAQLLKGLSGKQLEGLRAYVERVFPTPSQLRIFRSNQNTFVEQYVAIELFAKAYEVIETVDISDTEVELIITSLPDNNATFKLLSFDGKLLRNICTKGCYVRLYRGDYNYEVVMAGYKQKRFELPLLNRAPRLKLDCHMVKAGEAYEPPPCQETVVSKN
jgi:nitrate reductase cytochrome c-type subunit